MPQTSHNHTDDGSPRASIRLRVFLVLVIFGCYWLIDHSLGASIKNFEAEAYAEYDEGQNDTAQTVEGINPLSTLARLTLGGIGALCLVIPCQRRYTVASPILWTMAGYFAIVYSSCLWSIHPAFTLQKLIVLSVFLVSAAGVAHQLDLRSLAQVAGAVALLYLIIGFPVEVLSGTFRPWHDAYRFSGTSHPNKAAAYAAIVCLSASQWRVARYPATWFAPVALTLFGFFCVALTKSRTSLLALCIALCAVGFLRLNFKQRIYALSLGMIAACIGGFAITAEGGKLFESLSSVAAMGRTEEVSSLTGRTPLWTELLRWISRRPLLGHGYLAFWDSDRIERLSSQFNWEIPHGHNMYIDVALDVGLIGLVAYLVYLLTTLLVTGTQLFVTRRSEISFVFGMTLLALVHGGAESHFKLPDFNNFILTAAILCFTQSRFVKAAQPTSSISPTVFGTNQAGKEVHAHTSGGART